MTARLPTAADTEPPGLVPDVSDLLVSWLRSGATLGGRAVARVVVLTVDGGETSVSLPTPRPPRTADGLSEMARDILEVLEDRNGEWVHGADLVADLPGHPDHRSTAFSGPVGELKKANLIETSNKHGYRLKRKES